MGYRSYAVRSGESLEDSWDVDAFEGGRYHLCVQVPNGFFREFRGSAADPRVTVACRYEHRRGFRQGFTGNIALVLGNADPSRAAEITVTDNAYKNKALTDTLKPGVKSRTVTLDLAKSHRWYDFTVRVSGFGDFARRYAGRVETGEEGFTDPLMGGIV